MSRFWSTRAFLAVCGAILTSVPGYSAAMYLVTVDTTAITPGTPGNIDLQLNPGFGSFQAATATITGFTTLGGLLSGPPVITPASVSGALPGVVTIANSTAFNDYYQPFTFGSSFQFILALDGPAITSPNGTATSGSSFGLSLYDQTGSFPLLTTDPNGFAGIAEILLDGRVSTTTFPASAFGPSAVTFASIAIPEPATFGSLLTSLLVLGVSVAWRGRRKSR